MRHTSHSHAIISSSLLLFLLHAVAALVSASAETQKLQTETLRFGPFYKSDESILTALKDATIHGGALQLTPDSRNNVSLYLQNKSGRVIFYRPFKLWEKDSYNASVIASFNTTFDVNIFRDVNVAIVGEGLAFLIAPNIDPPPPGSEGGYLGLTNSTTDGNASNHLIAIELDTFQQPYDPDDNHVGLDINGVHSISTASLNRSNIVLSPKNAVNYTVWIEYDGPSRHIAVYIANQSSPKPPSPVISTALDLSQHLLPYSYFGFAGSTGNRFQLNCVLSWNLTVEIIPEKRNNNSWKLILVICVAALMVAIAAVATVVLFYVHKKKARGEGHLGDKLKSLPGMPREFKYGELKKATRNFRNELGRGGFGVVYKGKIDGDVGEVAVKMFSKDSKMDDFLQELTIINRLRHRHLVRLFGWCYRKGKLLLVYEFMPNGSLDWHLYDAPPESILPWTRRFTILTNVASALNYLHNEYEQKVVHRDLKASNILLDSQFNARLGDFGLARTIEPDRSSYAEAELGRMPGTVGYIAPECFHIGKATRESDVFGFGAVVLEVVCCRRTAEVEPMGSYSFLVDWVWMLYREGRIMEAVDGRLNGAYEEMEAERLLMLGLACSHPIAGERPKTEAIVQMISGSMPLPPVPHFKPAFVWPGTVFNIGVGGGMVSMGTNSTSSTLGTYTVYGGRSMDGWISSPDKDLK